ncbi:hypothetical protein [Methanococcoides burtonii]|uniref:Uncharacterized protein n=1 Tax=Methanococcoides burtonii (strain DSM 6242 / NBRC 107633 / OCM 468 / ACE-M) TaxID=259564 RepID=Q12WZ1_METBU|nr:hypothetical protein [Methanococcoides burtonii]ABE52035.1 Hypothetical protein Mbur_1108 [Methanococcoides burtonii DSM 6242]
MTNRKIIYFNLITVVLLLLYMALHLFIVDFEISNAQSSGGGLSYAKIGFFGPHIIDINGQESGSIISPSIVMTILLFFNLIFLVKNRFDKHIVLNIALLIATLLIYHLFLNNINSTLELATKLDSFYFSRMNIFGHEFIYIVEKIIIKGYNYSVIPIIISIVYNASKLISQSDANHD